MVKFFSIVFIAISLMVAQAPDAGQPKPEDIQNKSTINSTMRKYLSFFTLMIYVSLASTECPYGYIESASCHTLG